jgi:hypothetical protein
VKDEVQIFKPHHAMETTSEIVKQIAEIAVNSDGFRDFE